MINLIVDGNYILMRNVFALAKSNQLYGMLHRSLEISLTNYRTWYPFANIFFVSDSRGSWRKSIYPDYKANRKKDENIDWEFVYIAYNEFKSNLPKNVKLLEIDSVEGDDWMWYLTRKFNTEGHSNLIVSNDYDIKQLVNYSINPLYINIMINEIWGKEKIFLPNNYEIFFNSLKEGQSNDIFDLNDNSQLNSFFEGFILKRDISLVDNMEALFLKVISGDPSDNILSPYRSKGKTGKVRGIGESGAKKLYELYNKEFGELKLEDTDLYDNIADLILESKKLQIEHLPKISNNIKDNMNLICLDLIPNDIKSLMESKFV